MLGTCVFLLISSIPFIIPCYQILRRPLEILRGLVSISALYISLIQLLWTVGYMLEIYIYTEIYSYILYCIALSWTIYIMYKKSPIKIGSWLLINMIISLTVSIIWINIDDSPFRHGFMASLGMIVTPLAIVILSGYLQLGLWLLVKLHKWVNTGKKPKLVPIRQSVTTYIKILGFQVILSVLLESVFIFYNVVLSSIVIVLAIVLIFIVRNKLRGSYIFWILSWLGVCYIVVSIGVKYFPYPSTSIEETMLITRYQFEVWILFGLAIYHLLLMIYYRLRADDQIPEEMK